MLISHRRSAPLENEKSFFENDVYPNLINNYKKEIADRYVRPCTIFRNNLVS